LFPVVERADFTISETLTISRKRGRGEMTGREIESSGPLWIGVFSLLRFCLRYGAPLGCADRLTFP
jgi:hypothetical protein